MKKHTHTSGFTLIEIIIYIALFSIIITGCFVTAFELIDSSGRLNTKAIVEEEGNFVLRKIDWALTGTDLSNPPAISGSGCYQILTTNKTGFSGNPIVIHLLSGTGKNIEIKEGTGTFTPITTVNVSASCLTFTNIPANGSAPAGVTATVTINSINFSLTKYLRK